MLQESFHIVEARVRTIAPVKLKRAFYDGTGGPFDSYGMGMLTLTDADGTVGHTLGGGSELNQIFPHLFTSAPTRYGEIYPKMYWTLRNAGFRGPAMGALSSVDRALADIGAKRAKKPLHRYLGATRDWTHAYGSGGSTALTEDELIEELLGFAEMGFTTVKMKVGTNLGTEMQRDIARVKNVRKHLGKGVRLAVDANQAWSSKLALQFINSIADCDIAWFEEPVHSADLIAIREFCSASPVPAAFGESERSSKVYPSLVEAGVKHLQPNPLASTSIQEWFEVRDLAVKHQLPISLPGQPQVGCVLAAAAPETTLSEILFPVLWGFPQYFSKEPKLENGRFLLPSDPGNPLEVDFDYLEAKGLIREDTITREENVRNLSKSP
ncbi:MAG: enolase C-terminal domain-like protein [Polyangiaceae bacterium]|nr:enolase C-terminal domain-like protein [Polyangiaceae bacterium]